MRWTKKHRIFLPAFQFPLSSSDSLLMLWNNVAGLVISLQARWPRNCVCIPGTSVTFYSSRKGSEGLTPTTPNLLFNGYSTLFLLEQGDRRVKLISPIPSNADGRNKWSLTSNPLHTFTSLPSQYAALQNTLAPQQSWYLVVFVLQACRPAKRTPPNISCNKSSNTQRTENKTTDVVIHQHSRKLLKIDILISETCWAHNKWNKITNDIKLVFHLSTIAMMHGPINIK